MVGEQFDRATVADVMAELARHKPSTLFVVTDGATGQLLSYVGGPGEIKSHCAHDGETVVMIAVDLAAHDREVAARILKVEAAHLAQLVSRQPLRSSAYKRAIQDAIDRLLTRATRLSNGDKP